MGEIEISPKKRGSWLLQAVAPAALLLGVVISLAIPHTRHSSKHAAPAWFIATLDDSTIINPANNRRPGKSFSYIKTKLKAKLGCQKIIPLRALGQIAFACKSKLTPEYIAANLKAQSLIFAVEQDFISPESGGGTKCKASGELLCSDRQVLIHVNKILGKANQATTTNTTEKILINRANFFSCKTYSMRAVERAALLGYTLAQDASLVSETDIIPQTCKPKNSPSPNPSNIPASAAPTAQSSLNPEVTPALTARAGANSVGTVPQFAESSGTAPVVGSMIFSPSGIQTAVCGNRIREPGEACDGGACCTANCIVITDTSVTCDMFTGAKCTGTTGDCPTNSLPIGTKLFKVAQGAASCAP